MKIVNAETIETSEKEFIDAINAELDWVAIENMILEKHKLQLQDEVSYRQGDIVVHDNQIAYRLDFDITVSLSLTFNRDGECLDLETPDGQDIPDEDESEGSLSESEAFTDDLHPSNDGDNGLNLEAEISLDFPSETQKDFASYSEPLEQEETELQQNVTEQKNWSKVAPGLAEMIHDINQDSR